VQLARISLTDGCSSSNFKTLLSNGGLFVSITHTLTLHVCFVIMTKHRENPIVSSQSIYLLLIMGYCLNSIRVLQPAIAPRGPFGCVRALVTNGVKALLKNNCGATPNHKYVAQPAETGTS